KNIVSAQSGTRKKFFLPPDFQLTDAWRRRLYTIANTTDGTSESVGICGFCLLQTYQMIAELEEYYPGNPLTSGGYFFDAVPGTNPIDSFRRRFPLVYNILGSSALFYPPLTPTEPHDMIAFRMVEATTQLILTRFNWRGSSLATGYDNIIHAIEELLRAAPGTVWVSLITYLYPDGRITRHAVPLLRSQSGLIVIPTNTNIEFARFTAMMAETADPHAIVLRLAQWRNVTVTALATFQLVGEDPRPLNLTMSHHNCTGEGSSRRGSRERPRSATVNQCLGGRCSIL
ncbi:DUF1561 family protein, partial [Bartonella sp. F02]|uniref:DUF1561 family protein n=1 Tax=Bartonella sp. F02 TaxID=2967262 RepID=UPI0022A8EAD9